MANERAGEMCVALIDAGKLKSYDLEYTCNQRERGLQKIAQNVTASNYRHYLIIQGT